jgi:hypothetical protein
LQFPQLDEAHTLPYEGSYQLRTPKHPTPQPSQEFTMRHLNKKLAMSATAAALIGAIGVTFAQTDTNPQADPMATPQQVVIDGSASQPIYFFRDQGNSPESDPAAHLLLIKHPMQAVPVAESTTTTTTTVAQADTTTAMPAASDTSNTETSTDTTAAPVDTTPALPPKADRN